MQAPVAVGLLFVSAVNARDVPILPFENAIHTHAILLSLGFLVFLPLGVLVARYSRTVPALKGKWFTAHWFIQLVISGPLIFAGWAKAYNFVSSGGISHFGDRHRKIGLALLILYLVQLVWGVIIHFVKPAGFTRPLPPIQEGKSTITGKILPAIRGRPIQNYGHALNGLAIITLAFYNVRYGYEIEWPSTFGTSRANVAFLRSLNAWWISWVVIIPLIYIGGLFLLPRQWKLETSARRKEAVELSTAA